MIRRVGAAVAAVVVLVAMARGVDELRWQADLTAGRSLTLSSESREVVRRVDERVRVSAFLKRGERGRAEAAALLDRYHRLNPRITYRLRDPEESPGETRRLGVDPTLGGVAVSAGGRVERAPTVSEQDVTSSLARLLRKESPGVCFAVGHGEHSPASRTSEGLAAAAGALISNGYRIRTVDLLVAPAVPADCEALVLASPQAPLGPAEAAVARYLASGGTALVLADPSSSSDLNPLVRPYGLELAKGLLFEGDPDARLGDDPVTMVVRTYPSGNPAVRRLPPTVFPGAQAVQLTGARRDGLATSELARTTPLAYLERSPNQPRFDPGVDLPGPHAVVAAADLSSNQAGKVERTRLVVAGDVEFVTNDFVGEGGNARLLIQSLDWLTLDEDLVTVSANLPAYRPLAMTNTRIRYARFVGGILLPALFLLAGGLVAAIRRGR